MDAHYPAVGLIFHHMTGKSSGFLPQFPADPPINDTICNRQPDFFTNLQRARFPGRIASTGRHGAKRACAVTPKLTRQRLGIKNVTLGQFYFCNSILNTPLRRSLMQFQSPLLSHRAVKASIYITLVALAALAVIIAISMKSAIL